MKRLIDVKIGQPVRILKNECNPTIRKRILDMGLTKNTEVVIKSKAPLGDPYEIYLRGFSLTLRKSEIKDIYVEEI